MTALHVDFETHSLLDLKAVGLHNYANHRSTAPWCMAWAIGDGEPNLWTPGQPCPTEIVQHLRAGGETVAHNAPFELAIWNNICVPMYGWPELKPERTTCTMAAAYAMALPGALEDAALALGLHVLKDTEGRSLMLRMARPRRMDGDTPVWWDDPEKLARLYEYCRQDVRVERELHKRVLPLSTKERSVWLMDYRINQRGVQADVETAKAGVTLAEEVKAVCDSEIGKLTGGAVTTTGALIPLKQWLSDHGAPVDSLDKQSIVDLLATELPPEVRRALMLRQEASKSSTAKLAKIAAQAGADGRLRNLFQYHGAAPGRWTGRGVQPHNFVRDVPPPEVVEAVFGHVRRGEAKAIDMIYGMPLTMLSQCMRGFLTAAEGNVLVGADYSNVEGRGTAWVSGEDWKLAAFRAADAGTGPGIYELTAGKILRKPTAGITKHERQAYGKVPELALGYAGGVGAFQKMAKTYGVKMKDAQAEEIKVAWRAQHPRIVATWRGLNAAAMNAVRCPGDVYSAGHPGRGVKYKMVGSFLWCLLPSGRAICYPYPKLLEGKYGPQLTYMAVPNPDDLRIADPHNSSRWARIATHGGPLMQNVVSGICRDLLAEAMTALDAAGEKIVLHVHDDCSVETPLALAEESLARVNAAMNAVPAWAKGFPLAAKGKIMRRYGG
jgi:DNA polymerase